MAEKSEKKKRLATDRNRDVAIRCLAPRIFGALDHDGTNVAATRRGWIYRRSDRGDFTLDLVPRAHDLLFGVWWRGQVAIKGTIDLHENGNYFGGRLKVHTWARGAHVKHWQEQLFDVFREDSSALLQAPLKDLPAEIASLLKVPPADVNQLLLGGPLDEAGVTEERFWFELCRSCTEAAKNGIATDQIGVTAIELGLAILAQNHSLSALSQALQKWAVQVGTEQLDLIHGVIKDRANCSHAGACNLGQTPFSEVYRRPGGIPQFMAVWHVIPPPSEGDPLP